MKYYPGDIIHNALTGNNMKVIAEGRDGVLLVKKEDSGSFVISNHSGLSLYQCGRKGNK